MGTGRLHLALLPALILLSLSPAEQSGGSGWVFTEPQLRASAGDSVLLQCHFLDLENKGWTVSKVDWIHKAGAGTQEEMVFFYYSNRGVPAGRFKHRAQWEGNLSRRDGSIRLRDLHVNDSGTYECEIRLQLNSSIFKNRTVLHVSPPAQREGRGAAGAQEAAPLRDSGFWPAVVGCGCVAMVVAFLAGLCVRKRFAGNTALERIGNSKSKAETQPWLLVPAL
ncbi:junctional adhesion molecule-like [Pipra filicauda]|uniref:Junctional adhesion molecule-like n=1 Tax=Pipra filicauda TaxID=649802 RepID=A0A7R5L0J6_9PASS|nr:junctional adhesion molecule-like [Pipra filicauda]